MRRRDVLGATGVTVGTGFAGCLGGDSETVNDAGGDGAADSIDIAWLTDTHIAKKFDDDPAAYEEAGNEIPPTSEQTPGPRLYYTGTDKTRHFVDIANELQPDLAIHTGDTIDGDHSNADLELFLEEWEGLDDAIPTEILRGNHDVNDDYVPMLGYDSRSATANSVFNRSYTIENGDASVRIVTYDSHLRDDGGFVYALDDWDEINEKYGYAGQAPDFLVEWLKKELLDAEEETILMFSHAGPHTPSEKYFNVEEAEAIRDMIVEDVAPKKPDTRIYNLFGHWHNELEVTKFDEVHGADASDWPGYCNAAAVNREESSCGIVTVDAGGTVSFENRPIVYPYDG